MAPFLGAEIKDVQLPAFISKRLLRTASFSAQAGLAALSEAWEDAKLDGIPPERVGLIVGGSNFQQRECVQMQDAYQHRLRFLCKRNKIIYLMLMN